MDRMEILMKKILSPIFMILLAALFISAMPTEAEGAIYEDTVRLHILANSDSEDDQALKIEIRDAVLLRYGKELSVFESADDAADELAEKLGEVEEFVNRELKDRGYDYKSTVTIGTEWYETRKYESFTLPKGYYTSLRIIIGEGGGQNWWCVMFPPLCLDAATTSAKYTDAESLLIKKEYNVKFKILELISEIGR